MLRYFNILLNCIPLYFCYEYFEENQRFIKRNKNSEIENAKHELGKLVQFDVASFLRNTASEKLQNYEPFAYRNKNRDTRTQNEYYYESPLNENIKKRDENTNYLNIDSESDANDSYPSLTKDEDRFNLNSRFFGKVTKNEDELVPNHGNMVKEKNELLIDRDLIQNPENKCAFKNMKVPFFSRKPLTTKKQKKKLLCINCTKTKANDDSKLQTNYKIKRLTNKIKRAYGNLSPKCIRELLKKSKREPENVNQIHGSREFYQNVVTAQVSNRNDKRPVNNFRDYHFSGRLKRQENKEQARQLKELAEVEKKVDQFQVITPKLITTTANSYLLIQRD